MGREDILEKLPQQPFGSDFHVRTSLYGLGGAGYALTTKRCSEVNHDRKTQIALEYALRMKNENPAMSIFWVHAGSIERFRQAYSAIARQCQIDDKDGSEADILSRVKSWMESEKSGNWLMVLDNADDLELFCGKPPPSAQGLTNSAAPRPLKHYLPICTQGAILITTRNKQVGIRLSDDMPIEVASMSKEESQALLQTRLGHVDETSVKLAVLAKQLDHLPLALAQASAYIQETDISVERYLQLLEDDEQELVKMLSRDFEATGRDPETCHAVAHTWFISFQKIEKQCRVATQLLSLMSLLDRQDIPYKILSHYYFYLRPHHGNSSQSELEEALGILKSFSLVTGTDNGNFDIHRLVQLVTRQWINGRKTKPQFATAALYAMYHSFRNFAQSGALDRSGYIPLVSHAKELFSQDDFFYEGDSELKADLQLLLGVNLWMDGPWGEAESLVSDVIRYQTRKHGETHQNTLACRRLLGMIYHVQARWDESERVLEAVIGSAEQTLGKESGIAQTSTRALAQTYYSQGRYVEASRLLESLMAASISCQGDLPNEAKDLTADLTASTKRSRILRKFVKPLGVLRSSTAFVEVVAQDTAHKSSSKYKYGGKFVMFIMLDLAAVYAARGCLFEARLFVAAAFKVFQAPAEMDLATVLGFDLDRTFEFYRPRWPALPETSAREMSVIDFVSGSLGSVVVASISRTEVEGTDFIALMASQVLSENFDWSRPGAGDVAITLANICQTDGQYTKAYDVDARVLNSQMATLGARHLSTIYTMKRASRHLRSLSRFEEAETLCKQALEYTKGTPVGDLVVTLEVSVELSLVYSGQGRHNEAFKLLSNLLPAFVERCGLDHSKTLDVERHIGWEHQYVHSAGAATTILRSVLHKFRKSHGADFPSTLAASLQLAALKCSGGQIKHGHDHLKQLLPLYIGKYGEAHPDTIAVMVSSSSTASAVDHPSVAVDLANRALNVGNPFLESNPELHATLMTALSRAHDRLGNFEIAIDFGQRALELGKMGATTGPAIDLSCLCARRGLWIQARNVLEKHLESLLTRNDENCGGVLIVMQCLALAFQALGQLKEAVELQLQVDERYQSQHKLDDVDTHVALGALVLMYFIKSCPRPAVFADLKLKHWEHQCRTLGPHHDDTRVALSSCYWLATNNQNLHRFPEAERTLRNIVELHKEFFKADDLSTHQGLLQLALFLEDQHRPDEAAPLYEELLRLCKRTTRASKIRTLMAIRDLAECRVREKRLREATELFMEEAFRSRAALGVFHFRTFHALSLFSEQLIRIGWWNGLEQLQVRLESCPELAALAASRVSEDSVEDNHAIQEVFLNLARLEYSSELHELIFQIFRKTPRARTCTILATCNLAQVLMNRGALADSWSLLDPLLQRPRDSSLGGAHRLGLATASLARCNQQRGQWKEMGDQYANIIQLFDTHTSIEDIFESSIHLLGGLSNSDHDYTLDPEFNTSSAENELHDAERAYTMANRAREAADLVFGAEDEITLMIQVSISHMLHDKAGHGRAIKTLKDTVELQELALGPDHRDVQGTMETLRRWEDSAEVGGQATTLR